MWRNADVVDFVAWLREWNDSLPAALETAHGQVAGGSSIRRSARTRSCSRPRSRRPEAQIALAISSTASESASNGSSS
jgi:hypothetical protein